MQLYTAVQMAWANVWEDLGWFQNCPWHTIDKGVMCAFVQTGFWEGFNYWYYVSSLIFLLVYYLKTHSQTFYWGERLRNTGYSFIRYISYSDSLVLVLKCKDLDVLLSLYLSVWYWAYYQISLGIVSGGHIPLLGKGVFSSVNEGSEKVFWKW